MKTRVCEQSLRQGADIKMLSLFGRRGSDCTSCAVCLYQGSEPLTDPGCVRCYVGGGVSYPPPSSGREGGHLQADPLPQLLGLFPSLQVLQDVVKLHHPDRRQTERPSSAADDVHKVIVVSRG